MVGAAGFGLCWSGVAMTDDVIWLIVVVDAVDAVVTINWLSQRD